MTLPPRRRSVVFLHHSYYHFYYLAQALRRRGWDAVSVSVESPDGVHSRYYHGEDVNLFDPDQKTYENNISSFYRRAKGQYRLLHFATDTWFSFYPRHWQSMNPPDIIEWRRIGNKIAYTASGCNSGTAQSSVSRWSLLGRPVPICDVCPWQQRPDVCSDERNLRWGEMLDKYCDRIFAETLPALDYMAMPTRVIREPVTACLDPRVWDPGIAIPEQHRIVRKPGELVVFHGFGEYEARASGGRNIKGSPAIFTAVERLKAEGVPVRLLFIKDVRSTDVRYYQLQSDVIVDQLNMGRYGAIAREGMMLGKPVICYINHREFSPASELQSLKSAPLVSATEATVYEALRALLENPERREAIGVASREYALKWHGADECAARYEAIYDELMENPQRALGDPSPIPAVPR